MNDGDVIAVCEYAEFNHSFLSVGGPAYDVVLAPAIVVPQYAFIGASVRVHARNISSASPASYQVVVRGANPSRRDAAKFVDTTEFTTPTITNSANPTTVPGLTKLSTPVTQLQHPCVEVLLRVVPPGTGTVTLYIIISVDLICRTSG